MDHRRVTVDVKHLIVTLESEKLVRNKASDPNNRCNSRYGLVPLLHHHCVVPMQ